MARADFGCGTFVVTLMAVGIALKLAGVVLWPWWVVLLPLEVAAVVWFALIACWATALVWARGWGITVKKKKG